MGKYVEGIDRGLIWGST